MKIRILGTNLSMVVPCNKSDCQGRPYCLIVCGDTKCVAKVWLDPVKLQDHHELTADEVSDVLKQVRHYEHWFVGEFIFQGLDKRR